MQFSRKVQQMEPSVTLAVSAKAKAMRAEGADVVALSAGEPDFDTPQNIKDAAIRAIQEGATKYTPAAGTPELRKAVCAAMERDRGLTYDPAEAIVSCGAKQSLFIATLSLVDEGDEAIVPVPYWVTYPEQVKLAGGRPIILHPQDLKITPEELRDAITSRTKLLILNSPSNPSGAVYTKEELEALADVILGTDAWVLADEIYGRILYDGAEHHSIATLRPGMRDRTIVIDGMSKTYAMTGWRIGYAVGPAEAISMMGKIQSQETSNPCSIAQAAALEALTGPQESVGEMVNAFDQRRRYMVGRLNAMDGVSCAMPKGAFYAFPNVSASYGKSVDGIKIEGSVDLCDFLLEEMKVACVPGAGFGSDANIRLSYATSGENIEKGLDRLEEGLKRLK